MTVSLLCIEDWKRLKAGSKGGRNDLDKEGSTSSCGVCLCPAKAPVGSYLAHNYHQTEIKNNLEGGKSYF